MRETMALYAEGADLDELFDLVVHAANRATAATDEACAGASNNMMRLVATFFATTVVAGMFRRNSDILKAHIDRILRDG